MKNIRHEIALWVQAGTFIGLWVLLLYLSAPHLLVTWEAARRIPEVVVIYGLLYFVFTKWLWRLKVFQGWLIPFPDLEGTWRGTLASTWVDPETGMAIDPIPVVVAIRQSFSGLSCSMYTKESTSTSIASSFHMDEESGVGWIAYVYTNTPTVVVRGRSATHDGAVKLRVIKRPRLMLEGEYWSNRKTTGSIHLEWVERNAAEAFDAVSDE
jgi:hypothetical protein